MTRPYGALSLLVLGVALVTSLHQVQAADPVGRWRPLVEQAAAHHGVPADVILAIIAVESGGDPNARGAAGEIGLMQILPATGRLLGVSAAELRDPAVNIDTGARYLAIELRACGGDVACATAAYNGGPRARTNPLPSTRRYVAAVLARRATVLLPGMPATGQGEAVTAATVPAAGGRSRGATVAREE